MQLHPAILAFQTIAKSRNFDQSWLNNDQEKIRMKPCFISHFRFPLKTILPNLFLL